MDAYFIAMCVLLAIQLLAVSGRVYIRAWIVKAFGWDDVAAIICLIVASGYNCCIIATYSLAGGAVPIQFLRPEYVIDIVNLILASELLYIAGTATLKVALGLLLLRVLTKRWMKRTIWTIMSISVIYGTVFFFIVLFQCGSPSIFYRKIIIHQCLSVSAISGWSYTHAVLQAVADVVFATLPVVFLWDANFTKRAKISVGGILMLGSLGCIVTFLRIGWIHYLSSPTLAYLVTAEAVVLMSGLELSIGLVCLSLATYKPLMHRIFGRPNTYNFYYDESSRTGQSWASQHGVAEEVENVSIPDRNPRWGLQSPAPVILGRDTPTKSWGLAVPYAESESDVSDSRGVGRAVGYMSP